MQTRNSLWLLVLATSATCSLTQGEERFPEVVSDRSKIVLDSDLPRSVGAEQTWGLDRIHALVEDPQNVGIRIRDCQLDGFRLDKSEYRADNALRSSASGTITARIPQGVAGQFFVGFIFYDSAGREVVRIDVRGEKRGVVVADFDDNNQHLFFLTEPVELKAGDEIRLRSLGAEGTYRTEDLVLLRHKPVERPPVHEFREVAATQNRLTWITTWATRCTVEYVVENQAPQRIVEEVAVQNHRLTLADVRPQQRVRYRVLAPARDGKEVASPWQEFTWQPALVPSSRRTGHVTLRVEPPAGAPPLHDWPVTSGVPFAKGDLGSKRNARLLDSQGQTLPLQAAVTGRWADGSVKWLLVDFRHSGPAAAYTLEFGPDIDRGEPDLPAATLLDFGELVLADAAGREHSARVVDLRAEEGAGLRAGWHGSGPIGSSRFSWEARVHVYPGLPWARVLLTFGHDVSPDEFTTVRSLAWRLPSLRGETQFVRQHTDNQFESSAGLGKRFSGALGLVLVRDFWQNYPKDLEIGNGGATLWLLPRLKPDEFDWAQGTFDEHRLFFWFDPHGAGGEAGGYSFNNYDFTNCRDAGWHLILTLGVYRATGDPFYLNAARIIVQRVLERQTPDAKFNTAGGGWRRMMVPGHCLCEPAHYGNAGFMVGVLLTGLKWYHLETQDDRVAESLIQASHFLIDDMWAEDVGGFRYTCCPESSRGAWSNFLLFDGMAYAYRLTQQAGRPDEKLATHLRKGTEPAIQAMSGMGKSFSQFIRVTPHFMGILAELQEQDAP